MYWEYILVLAIVLFVVEMTTGTFYFLIMSIAFAITSLLSYIFKLSITSDIFIASGLSLIGFFFVYKWHKNHQRTGDDFNPNIGNKVVVEKVLPGGLLEVSYRGTTWSATTRSGEAVEKGATGVIVAQKANTLVISPD